MGAGAGMLMGNPNHPMPAIKIQLDSAEYAAVLRFARELHVKPEDVAYAALNRLMLGSEARETRVDIVDTKAWRGDNLPMWSDSAGAVHAYESMPDEESAPRRRGV